MDDSFERAAAKEVMEFHPLWPDGLSEEGPFIVPAKLWGKAVQVAAAYLRLSEPSQPDKGELNDDTAT